MPVPHAARDMLSPETEDAALVRLFDALLLDAIAVRASDLHLERYGDRVRLRMRVDGDLRDETQFKLSASTLDGLINVLKINAQLDITERRIPQGDRFSRTAAGRRYDLRVQTQPTLHGEHVVIRLLPQQRRAKDIESLGFSHALADSYRRLLSSPQGLVLVVGPTGSGKSTTLYGGLDLLAKDATRKVVTAEDPIEYELENVQQTQIRPDLGFSFAQVTRAFVREDPDVILIGEIRDAETALEAMRASQTGHLVLSTLHCNDATDAVQRLFDLGVHPNTVASELLAVIAQRLAKRICERCRVPATPDPALLEALFGADVPRDFTCFVGEGCAHCDGTGSFERIAVVELLPGSPKLRMGISRRLQLDELRQVAAKSGLVRLREQALTAVQQGLIALPELRGLLTPEQLRGG